jgi:thioredoxin-related protein
MGFLGKTVFVLTAVMAFSSCADKEQKLKDVVPPPGVGPIIRRSDGGTPVTPGGNVAPGVIQATAREDIAWTDADNPDAGIPEIENLMAAPKKGPWEESETTARQIAAREGKPILIWFTDSARSPMCKALSAELFSTKEFGKWAGDHLVRLRVDSNISVDDPDLSLDEKVTRQSNLKDYVKRLKKRYRILGAPSVLMLNPSGEVIARYRGYKRGEADYFWGLIKQGEVVSSHAYKSWRKDLENKGYREWEGTLGNKVFAKLVNYSNGVLVLIEPGGERYKTTEGKLSSKDKKWIAEQKALRGIE